jgi:hypothetical protein
MIGVVSEVSFDEKVYIPAADGFFVVYFGCSRIGVFCWGWT